MNPAELFRHETDALQLTAGDSLFQKGDKGEKEYVVLEGEMEIVLGARLLSQQSTRRYSSACEGLRNF